MKLTAINIIRRSTRNKLFHIARHVNKQGVLPSVSDQAGVEMVVTGLKSPVNNGQETAHTRLSPNNGPSVINTKNVTKTKKKQKQKQKWSRDEYREVIEPYYTAIFFLSKKSNTI